MALKKVKTEEPKNSFAADKSYRIVSKVSARAMDTEGDETIYMAKSSRRENQAFAIVLAEEGCYKIANKKSGKVLDIMLAGVNDGAQIHLWDFTGADNQLWNLEPTEDGCYKIKAKSSGKCIDVVGMSLEEGALLQIWEDMGGDNQKWILKEVADSKTAVKAPTKTKMAEKRMPEKKAAATRTRKPKTEEK